MLSYFWLDCRPAVRALPVPGPGPKSKLKIGKSAD